MMRVRFVALAAAGAALALAVSAALRHPVEPAGQRRSAGPRPPVAAVHPPEVAGGRAGRAVGLEVLDRAVPPSDRPAPAGGVELWILNSLLGQVEPCQCQIRNLGSISEQIGVIDESRARSDGALRMALYAGPLFDRTRAEEPGVSPWLKEWFALRAAILRRALVLARPVALMPSADDLGGRPDEVARLCDALPGRVVCSNWRGNAPAIVPEVRVTEGSRTVLIRGVACAAEGGAAAGSLRDPLASLRGMQPVPDPDTLLVVGIAFSSDCPADRLIELLGSIEPRALVVLSGVCANEAQSERIGAAARLRNAPVITTRPRGVEWAVLGSRSGGSGAPWANATGVLGLLEFAGELDRDARLGAGGLAERIAARIADERRALAGARPYVISELGITLGLPRPPAIEALLEEYRDSVADIVTRSEAAPASDAPLGRAYRGAAECARCHEEVAAFWSTTKHASAYASLEREGREGDPSCLVCHTTGFLRPTGYRPRGGDGTLASVQCEACHGAGGTHPADHRPLPPVSERSCLHCHDELNSPRFDFATYAPRIRCPPRGER